MREFNVIGQTVNHYRITARLGAGGMGEVFLAEDTVLDRHVALKFLPAALWNDADARQRLIREAKAASKLDHPNIVTIYGIEESEGRPFIVMAHVAGTTIDKHIASHNCSVEEVIGLALQTVEGLQHAHLAGVVHRDLKPGNILVDDRGRVRILDFGLARIRGTSRLTQAGSIVGTLAYLPPELIQGSDAEPSSDIYSFGVVLYQMLTGHLPFEADHEAALLYSILQEAPRPISDYNPAIPESLQTLVMRCLERKPDGRFPNCAALSAALRNRNPGSASGIKALPPRDKPSIVVLPFVNMSRDEESEYFSDGLSEELMNMLAKIRGLRVAARTSSFHFKGKDATITEVGRALNVGSVLEGSVRKSGSRVRINVQLVKVSDGFPLWSETYDRTLEDLFAVQDNIAQSVVRELRSTLLGEEADSSAIREVKAEVASAAKGRGHNPEAHRLYLQARHLFERVTREDVTKGIGYLKEAIRLDPDFALAWSELGVAYANEANQSWVPVAEGYERSREAVLRSLSLEPDLAEGHARLGWIQMSYDWDWQAAEKSLCRALDLEPDNTRVLRVAGVLATTQQSRLEDAVGLFRRAAEMDPLSAAAYHNFGSALSAAGRLAEAEEALRKAMELAPQRSGVHAALSFVLLARGRGEEALAEVLQEPMKWMRLWVLAIVHHGLGHVTESEEVLQELIGKHSEDSACQIAQVYAVRGEVDQAFLWIERAYTQRDPGLCDAKTIPSFRPLHSDPRWTAFLEKMGLSD